MIDLQSVMVLNAPLFMYRVPKYAAGGHSSGPMGGIDARRLLTVRPAFFRN